MVYLRMFADARTGIRRAFSYSYIVDSTASSIGAIYTNEVRTHQVPGMILVL